MVFPNLVQHHMARTASLLKIDIDLAPMDPFGVLVHLGPASAPDGRLDFGNREQGLLDPGSQLIGGRKRNAGRGGDADGGRPLIEGWEEIFSHQRKQAQGSEQKQDAAAHDRIGMEEGFFRIRP